MLTSTRGLVLQKVLTPCGRLMDGPHSGPSPHCVITNVVMMLLFRWVPCKNKNIHWITNYTLPHTCYSLLPHLVPFIVSAEIKRHFVNRHSFCSISNTRVNQHTLHVLHTIYRCTIPSWLNCDYTCVCE